MINGSDGIGECETIIKKYNGKIEGEGFIIMIENEVDNLSENERVELLEAVSFLINEWDYGYEEI